MSTTKPRNYQKLDDKLLMTPPAIQDLHNDDQDILSEESAINVKEPDVKEEKAKVESDGLCDTLPHPDKIFSNMKTNEKKEPIRKPDTKPNQMPHF
jgi:hypothetical protein